MTISSTDKDQFGLPVAPVNFNLHDNDHKFIEFGKSMVMDVTRAAGADEVLQEPRYAHLVGAARMGKDPATSVLHGYGGTHDIANLFLRDGSVMHARGLRQPRRDDPGTGGGHGGLSHLARHSDLQLPNRDMTFPPVRRELSPPGTHRAGVPRLG